MVLILCLNKKTTFQTVPRGTLENVEMGRKQRFISGWERVNFAAVTYTRSDPTFLCSPKPANPPTFTSKVAGIGPMRPIRDWTVYWGVV